MSRGVSVIIPVYQGVEYLEAAVGTALEQPEVDEVIISDDGSTDGSWEMAKALERNNPSILAITSEDRMNRGVSVARNTGAERASNSYIAFLDADDYYLPTRFATAAQLLASDPAVGAVYEPVGTSFTSDEAESVWYNDLKRPAISWTGQAVPPEALFDHLCTGRHFHIAGVTLRKDVFFSAGGFNPLLQISEDTELWLKLSLCTRVVAGSTRVVAMRRIHGNNTIIRRRAAQPISGELKWRQIAKWAAERRLPYHLMDKVSRNLVLSIERRHLSEKGNLIHIMRDVAMTAAGIPRIALTHGYWIEAFRCSRRSSSTA